MQRNDPPGRLARWRERLTAHPSAWFDASARVIVYVTGPLSVRELSVDAVRRVEAGNRDYASFDTVFLFFHADEGVLVVSEKDKGFLALVADLGAVFPGIEGWRAAVPSVAYQLTSVDLWVGA